MARDLTVREVLLLALLAASTLAGCGGATNRAEPPVAPATPDPPAAVLQVKIEPCEPGSERRATAVAIGEAIAATAAHPLDTARSFDVVDDGGLPVAAELVWLDPARDLALLQLVDPPEATLPLGDADDGAEVEVVTAADPGGFTSKPASILRHVPVTLDGDGERAAIELEAEIEPGDSGSPVLNTDGEVVGIVFAAARGQQRGWAIAAEELSAALARRADQPLSLTCEPHQGTGLTGQSIETLAS